MSLFSRVLVLLHYLVNIHSMSLFVSVGALARLQADVVGGPNPYKDVRFQEEYYKGKLGGHIE